MQHKCFKCGAEFDGNFCPECGEKWQKEKQCPKCGKTVAGGVKFCPNCGHSFVSAAAISPTKPKPTIKQPSEGTGKLFSFVSIFPKILFGLLSVAFLFVFLAPAAVMPGGEIMGQTIPGESYGSVYQIQNFEDLSVGGSLTALIVIASFAAALTGLLILFSLFSITRYKRVVLWGNPVSLPGFLTGIGYVSFLSLFLVSCILLGQISKEDGGLGILAAGAAPILTLVISLLGCLIALICALAGGRLRKAYPALAEAETKKFENAQPTAFEVWMKKHRKAVAVVSILFVAAVVVGVSVSVAIANRHNGIYYVYHYETEEYNMERFYKLSGSTWQDENGNKGEIVFDGENVRISYDASHGQDNTGSSKIEMEGTLINDVLKIGNLVYAKEGHEHEFENDSCLCGAPYASFGLDFKEIDENTVAVSGLGSCESNKIVIPEYYNKKLVVAIGNAAFRNCKSLKSIEIPASVTSIGEKAFAGCGRLKEVYIHDLSAWCRINFEDYSANPLNFAHHLYLNNVELDELIIPNEIVEIKKYAFYNCSELTSVTIHDSVTSIGDEAFHGCSSLTSVTIHDSVTSIGDGTFGGCSGLTSIEIPNSVTSIGDSTFCYCSGLKSVIWNAENCTEAGDCFAPIFSGCTQLTTVTFGDKVKAIPSYAFYDCSKLTSVTIGRGVISIGDRTFYGCSALESIEVAQENPVYHSAGNCLIETQSKTLIVGCKTSVIPNDGSVTSIGDWAFGGCSSLTSITISHSLKSIGKRAFDDCDSLKSVYYMGTSDEWSEIQINSYGNSALTDAKRYYYSAEENYDGEHWHYDPETGEPVVWTKENG